MIGARPQHQHVSLVGSHIWPFLPQGTQDEKEGASPIGDLQRTKRHLARAYVRLRRYHAQTKAQRALHWKLKRAYKAEYDRIGSIREGVQP